MKRFILLLLTSAMMVPIKAQDKVPGIIVELSNGKKVEYRLVDNPKFVFDGTKISLTAEGVSIEYTPSELKKVVTGEVENIGSGIIELKADKGTIDIENGFIRLTGFNADETVHVYNINGVQQETYRTSSNGSLIIPMSALHSGISIINISNQSIKVTKK